MWRWQWLILPGRTIGSGGRRQTGSASACAGGEPQEAVELLVCDRRGRGADPCGKELQEALQPNVVEQRCRLDYVGCRLMVSRFQHTCERFREVLRQPAHRSECKRRELESMNDAARGDRGCHVGT